MTAESPLARLVAVAEELGLEFHGLEVEDTLATFYLGGRAEPYFCASSHDWGAGLIHWWRDDGPICAVATLAEAEDALRRWARGDG